MDLLENLVDAKIWYIFFFDKGFILTQIYFQLNLFPMLYINHWSRHRKDCRKEGRGGEGRMTPTF